MRRSIPGCRGMRCSSILEERSVAQCRLSRGSHTQTPIICVQQPEAYYSWWIDKDGVCGNICEQITVCERVVPSQAPTFHAEHEMALLVVRGDS